MALSVNIKKKLSNFSLQVCFETEDEVLALLGASGSGKSVTLRCIAGIMTPDEGTIVLDGRVLFDSEKGINLPCQKRGVGYLFQQYALFPNMTVRQNIEAVVKGKAKSKAASDELLRRFQLEDVAGQRPAELSGGQQQRAEIARILATEPKILLLDEPFAAVDSYLQAQLELELLNTLDGFGGSIVWVSHDRNEVFRNCAKICVLDAGRSKGVLTPKELFSNPRNACAAKLSGCKNVVVATRDGKVADLPDWGVALDCGRETAGTTEIGIRAHHLYFCEAEDKNAFLCDVVRTMDNVFSTILILRPRNSAPNAPVLRMELSKDKLPQKFAAQVFVAVAPENILLLKD